MRQPMRFCAAARRPRSPLGRNACLCRSHAVTTPRPTSREPRTSDAARQSQAASIEPNANRDKTIVTIQRGRGQRTSGHDVVARRAASVSEVVMSDESEKKPSSRDRIVELATANCTILRGEDSAVYLVPHSGRNVALGSGEAKGLLRKLYLEHTGRVAGRTPVDEAWATIEGLA